MDHHLQKTFCVSTFPFALNTSTQSRVCLPRNGKIDDYVEAHPKTSLRKSALYFGVLLNYKGPAVYRNSVVFNVLTGGTLAPAGPFACPSSEEKIKTLTQVAKVKMGPFSMCFSLVNKTMLLMLLAK